MFINKTLLILGMVSALTLTRNLEGQSGMRMVAPPAKASGLGGGWWQKVDGSLDLATAMTEMRARGRMGISEECDYNKFLETIKSGANSLKSFKDLNKNKAKGRWGLPTVDALQTMLHIGEAVVSAKAAKAERDGLIEHIEQVCQVSVQQDEVKRQLEMVQMAKKGTEKSVAPMLGILNLQKATESLNHEKIAQEWSVNYRNTTPQGAIANDTLWRAADQVLLANYQITSEFKSRLNDLDAMLEVAANQMYIPTDANGLCPGGARPPAKADTLNLGQGIKRLACAPVSEERATQVLAQITLLRTQAKALRVAAMAHITQVKLIEANHTAVMNKKDVSKRVNGLTNGF